MPDNQVWPVATSRPGLHQALARPKGRGWVRYLSRKDRNKGAGTYRNWWTSHSIHPNGNFPWLTGNCVLSGRVRGVNWGPWSQVELWCLWCREGPASYTQMDWAAGPKAICVFQWFPQVTWGNLRLWEGTLSWDNGTSG